ncbi:MAG TPA: ATP-binding protein [Geomonas sp.]|nr:ATP-binding protein [Geomonas sp.]
MVRLTTLSIRSLLMLITFMVALSAAGIILYSGIQFRNHSLKDASLQTLKLVDRISSEQQNLVAGATQLMTTLSQLPEVTTRDKAKVEPILRELCKLNPMYSNIFIADPKGAVWATAIPVTPRTGVADRRYFQNAMTTGQLSSGEYIVARSTIQPAINLAYPFKNGRGEIIGVISVSFGLHRYGQILKHMHLPERSNILLIDHRGIILYRAINPEQFIGKPYMAEPFRKISAGPETGTDIRLGMDGRERIISYRKLQLEGEQTPYMYVMVGTPLDAVTREANRFLTNTIVLFMSSLLLACVSALLIGKYAIVNRLRILETASQRLAGGDLDVRVSDLVVGGELGRLGERFDVMAAELARRESERDQLISMLASANQDLEAFNYTVAHDLRQPLNMLSSYCQVITNLFGDQLPAECKEYVEQAYEKTFQMHRLIEALLNFSRMGKAEPHREMLNISMLAREVSLSLNAAEPERRVEFRIDDGIMANGDPSLLRAVLANILGNAWKYTRTCEKAVIEFGARSIDGELEYFVKDNGVGFDMAHAGKIFTPFQRLPGAEEFKGYGIGLATVERIIRRHGGRIWAEGEKGKGATFFFTLPHQSPD